jgi:nucleoside-diphosphate-sugar epimerase
VKVLVTGAFGNVGSNLAREVVERDHDVVWFDVDNRANRTRAKAARGRVVWGDIRDAAAVAAAVEGCDRVIHLAAIIPPGSIRNPVLAEAVNVGGTRNVIAACQQASSPPKLAFASSVALFGPTQHLEPPRTLDDPINPTDDYTRHKAACEDLLNQSGLDVAILRLGAVIPIEVLGVIDPLMFEVPLTDRVEFVHPADVARAFLNAVESDQVWGRTFLVGGGKRCQIRQREIINKPLVALGIGELPDEAFTAEPFQIDWVDTAESQALLDFQRYDYDDCVRDMVAGVGWRRLFIPLARPIARRKLLSSSPYWKARSRS